MSTNNAINNWMGPIVAGFTYFCDGIDPIVLDTWTAVTFNATEMEDIDGNFNNATGVYTVPSDGLYVSIGSVKFDTNSCNGVLMRFIVKRAAADICIPTYGRTNTSEDSLPADEYVLNFTIPILLETNDEARMEVACKTQPSKLLASAQSFWTMVKQGYF